MTAMIFDGCAAAKQIKLHVKSAIAQRLHSGQSAPGLAVVLVGNDPASEVYVKHKHKASEEAGIISYDYKLAKNTSEKELLQLINTLNANPAIHGILVQLPLPAAINSQTIIEAISPLKDVDGFHPYNLGRLAQRNPVFRPCTPYGIMQLLNVYKIPLAGKHAVVVGASNIVGKPMALEFLLAGATITVCHRLTNNLAELIKSADIVVSATGVKDIIDCAWLKAEQVVVDVGIHRLANGQICGDIDFNQAREKVSWITPVPGGVGPMTIAALMQNTLLAAELAS